MAEHPEVFDHVGLLFNEPSSYAGMLFIKSSDDIRINSVEPFYVFTSLLFYRKVRILQDHRYESGDGYVIL